MSKEYATTECAGCGAAIPHGLADCTGDGVHPGTRIEPCDDCGGDLAADGTCRECEIQAEEAGWQDEDEDEGGSPWGR